MLKAALFPGLYFFIFWLLYYILCWIRSKYGFWNRNHIWNRTSLNILRFRLRWGKNLRFLQFRFRFHNTAGNPATASENIRNLQGRQQQQNCLQQQAHYQKQARKQQQWRKRRQEQQRARNNTDANILWVFAERQKFVEKYNERVKIVLFVLIHFSQSDSYRIGLALLRSFLFLE